TYDPAINSRLLYQLSYSGTAILPLYRTLLPAPSRGKRNAVLLCGCITGTLLGCKTLFILQNSNFYRPCKQHKKTGPLSHNSGPASLFIS
ncbi:hypothetical protein, partial [Acetobacter okinawensis]|uniref:hypothetical protein n=1 Tax=Acetobacter okinawensis TaxID=1076594 RepID=UPI0039E86A35